MDEKEQLDATLQVRVTKRVDTALTKIAQKDGIKKSDLIRKVISSWLRSLAKAKKRARIRQRSGK